MESLLTSPVQSTPSARLVETAERSLEHTITGAATAYPPGIGATESRACRFVLEEAGLNCTALIDEVSAANTVLNVRKGVLVDVGAGSTGVGVFVGGRTGSWRRRSRWRAPSQPYSCRSARDEHRTSRETQARGRTELFCHTAAGP